MAAAATTAATARAVYRPEQQQPFAFLPDTAQQHDSSQQFHASRLFDSSQAAHSLYAALSFGINFIQRQWRKLRYGL
jgi:hypothetical protein